MAVYDRVTVLFIVCGGSALQENITFHQISSLLRQSFIGVNRPDLGGTVPLLGCSSRCPALH